MIEENTYSLCSGVNTLLKLHLDHVDSISMHRKGKRSKIKREIGKKESKEQKTKTASFKFLPAAEADIIHSSLASSLNPNCLESQSYWPRVSIHLASSQSNLR